MNYKIDSQNINNNLQEVISSSSYVEEVINKLKNELDVLEGAWNDNAFSKFKTNYLSFLEEVRNLNGVYSKLAYTSKGIVEDFEDVDNKNYYTIYERNGVSINE